MVKRKFYVARVLASLAISVVIFALIFSFAQWVSYNNYTDISEKNIFIENSLEEMERALNNLSCDGDVLISASGKLDQVGAGLALLETRLGKENFRVLEQKKLYSELELKHFNLINKLKSDCNATFMTILFFYSNKKDALRESDIAGKIVGTFKRRDPSNIMVYSFDYNLDSLAINGLISEYNVSSTPQVVINEGEVIDSLENIGQLEKHV